MPSSHLRRGAVAATALAAAFLIGACGDSSGDGATDHPNNNTPAGTATSPSTCPPGDGIPSETVTPGGDPSETVTPGGGPSEMATPGGGPFGAGPGEAPGGPGGGDCADNEGSGGGAGEPAPDATSTVFTPRGTDLGGAGRGGPVGAPGDILPPSE